jgi:hypothetical protein
MTEQAPRDRQADSQLDNILRRVKYVGPKPPPSEDEVMEMAAEEIRAVRAQRGTGRL